MSDSSENSRSSKKKEQIIAAARNLFVLHGMRRVTIEEICRNAGVSKRTCYKYFKDKWDIARSVIDSMFAESFEKFHDMISQDASFPEKFEKMLVMVTSNINNAGAAFLEDAMKQDSPLYDYFEDMQKQTRQMSIQFFKEAQQAGQINSDIKMSFMLFMLDRQSELINHPDLVKIMPDIEERASELARQLFQGFSRVSK